MASKKMTIAFPKGGKIPGKIIGRARDIDVPALQPVDVPVEYGQQLIDDKFAYLFDPEKAPKATLSDEAKAKAFLDIKQQLDDRTAAVENRERALEDRETALAKMEASVADQEHALIAKATSLAVAHKAMVDARAAVSAAVDETAKTAAEGALAKAEADFAGLAL